MTALMNPNGLTRMPAVAKWLGHAEATRRIMLDKYGALTNSALVTATVEENVLVQLENLRTHPAVAVGVTRGKVKLHGWVYKIETGQVFAYQPENGQFLPLVDVTPVRTKGSQFTAAHAM
jgi:carbonic anhydrase